MLALPELCFSARRSRQLTVSVGSSGDEEPIRSVRLSRGDQRQPAESADRAPAPLRRPHAATGQARAAARGAGDERTRIAPPQPQQSPQPSPQPQQPSPQQSPQPGQQGEESEQRRRRLKQQQFLLLRKRRQQQQQQQQQQKLGPVNLRPGQQYPVRFSQDVCV